MMRMCCLGVAMAVLNTGLALAADFPTERDPALWPFAADDPWNHPIGSEARYEKVEYGFNNRQTSGSIVNCLHYSVNVFRAAPDDPRRNVRTWYGDNGGQFQGTIRMPENAAPSVGTDAHMAVIDESGRVVTEMGLVQRDEYGHVSCWLAFQNDLTGPGFFPRIHGTRAAGTASLGGLIRKGELTGGIRHALAVGTDPSNLNSNAPGGKTFVWPACSSDYEFPQSLWPPNTKPYEDWYGKRGNLFIGSLLAIPPDVDVAQLGFGDSGPMYEIAKAFQDYGGYVVDMAGAPLVLYAEPSAQSELGELNAGGGAGLRLDEVLPHLRLVANNGPDRIGGGGKPRVPFAPPFKAAGASGEHSAENQTGN